MTTYSIDLDDVDLALLPLRTYRYNDFLKKEHFQFQMMKTDVVEQPEPTILYTCHICDIEVPAAFAREHTASIKHRANARIASVAAERTRALITALAPPAAASTARFCANCATTVGKNHEKTKEHRVSVMHDKMLWELMTAYVGDDDVSNYDSEDSDTDLSIKEKSSKDCNGFGTWDVYGKDETQKKCDRALKTIETTNKDINKTEATEENQYKDKKNVDNKTKISETDKIESGSKGERTDSKDKETELRTGTESETKKEDTATSTKPKEDTATSTKPKAAEIKIEYVEFVTKDNKQVKVFSDYYHSFIRKVDTINCIVCNSTFENNEVDSHMFSLKHLNKMPSTLIDKHCVRQINDTYSHCILCNQMVKNSNVTKHHLTFGHGQREKQAVTDQSTASNIDKTSNISATVNNNVINMNAPKTEKQAVTYAQSTASKIDKAANINVASSTNLVLAKATMKAASVNGGLKLKAPEKAKNATNGAKESIDWPVIYPYEITKQECTVRCVICDCQVPNNPDNRKAHLVGLNHAKNVKNKRLMYEYEAIENSNIARCVTCDVSVTMSPRNLKEHLKGRTHADNAKTNRVSYDYELSYEAIEEPNGVLCRICGGIKKLNSPYDLCYTKCHWIDSYLPYGEN